MKRVTIFVEDPGAANYAARLPAALRSRGVDACLLATDLATSYFTERGVPFEAAPPSAEAVLRETRPDAVVVGTSENVRSTGLELVRIARAAYVPTVGVVDAFANAAYRFRGSTNDALAYAPDTIIVPDDATRDVFLSLGARKVVACGHPHYDVVLEKRRELEASDRDALRARLFGDHAKRRVIVFAAEVSTGLNEAQFARSEEYTLHGRGARHRRTEIVLEELLDARRASCPDACVTVRLHPKNTPDDFGGLLDEADFVSRGGSPLDVVFAADLVVGMTTMLLVEAALVGSRTAAILPRPCEADWLPSIGTGATAHLTTRPAIADYLTRWSSNTAAKQPAFLVAPNSLDAVCAAITATLETRSERHAHGRSESHR